MVAMTVGLLLVAGAIQQLLANRSSFVLQQQLAAVQENTRFVLARLGRDIRQAGAFGCLDLQRLPAPMAAQLP
ncbi:MAG: pilus assembly protein PilW, partial [Pseudomonadaceae bacterium]|nr:pilus assembly protein PilW [Pseudomonadaceae bacterium]